MNTIKSQFIIFLFALLLIFHSKTALHAQDWQAFGDLLGSVYALHVDQATDMLYIGMSDRYFEGIEGKGIVRWDGVNFSTLGDFPNGGCNYFNCNPVHDIIVFQGDVYCTIYNPSPDPGVINGVARWDGENWEAVGESVSGVNKFTIFQDELYMMGAFEQVGDEPIRTIAKWDGQKWVDLKFPFFTEPGSSSIGAAIEHQGALYVGGNFRNEDQTVVDIARFDGENWYPVGSGTQDFVDVVSSFAVFQGELYAAGGFSNTGSAGIMKLQDGDWTDVGGGIGNSTGGVSEMLVHQEKLYVFGLFSTVGDDITAHNLASWDGKEWCGFTQGMNSKFGEVVWYKDHFIVSGGFDSIDGSPIQNIAKWTGQPYCFSIDQTAELGPSDLLLHPNPAGSFVWVEWGTSFSFPLELQLFDALGRAVRPLAAVPPASKRYWLDTDGLPNGIYFLSIKGIQSEFGLKLIIAN